MYVPDETIFLFVGALALFFTYESVNFPLTQLGNMKSSPGTIYGHLRAMGFPYFAALCWWVMSTFADALNNCQSAFGGAPSGCFTSPTWAATTSSIFPAAGSDPLTLLFLGLFWVWLLIGIIMTIYLAIRPIVSVMEGKETLTTE